MSGILHSSHYPQTSKSSHYIHGSISAMKTFTLISLVMFGYNAIAQTTINRDPEIEQMVKEVSSDSLRSYVNKMVSFGTRNTMSSATHPKRGIGAARNWVLGKFKDYAKKSNGRLT